MPLDEKIQQLDERITGRFKDWVRDLHEQLSQGLNDEIARQLEEATSRVPERLMDPDQKESITAAASSAGGEVVLGNLLSAMVGIDQAAKQTDILQALLEGAGAFASRLAIFLTRADQASGWAAVGFGSGDAAIPGLVVEYEESGPWDRLSQGRSSIRLSAADCERLCRRVEAPTPGGGVLIPLVLRDQVAAALYADHLQDDPGGLGIEGLQLLAYVSAQAIENLPFRQRTSTTPTLVLSSEEGADQEGLGLWEGAGGAAAVAVAAVGVSEAIEEEPEPALEIDAEEEVAEVEVDLEDGDLLNVSDEPTSDEPVSDEPTSDEPSVDQTPAYTDTQELRFQGPAAEETPKVPTMAWEDPDSPSDESSEPAEAKVAWAEDDSVEDRAVVEPIVEADDAWAVDATPDVEDSEPGALWEVEEDEPEDPVEVAADTEDLGSQLPGIELPEPELPESRMPEIEVADPEPLADAPAPSWEVVDQPATVQSVAPAPGLETIQAPLMPSGASLPKNPLEDDATMLLQKAPVEPAPPEDAVEEEGDETHPGISSEPEQPPTPPKPGRASEVQPPADVEGPGWAFSKDAVKASDDDEDHKQAKRLARLLVSEIKLYNEEQVEQGQKNNNIYERLREDIDRSRQVYEDRVNERVRSTNDYFYQELVRTLAAGDSQALGI